MVIPLRVVDKTIQILLIIWIVIGVVDLILTTIYCSKPLFQFYLLFPSRFPSIAVYFIIAFISVLVNHSFVVIDYHGVMFGPYSYTLKDAIQEHYDCSNRIKLGSLLISIIATICFCLSPLLSLPMVIFVSAKRAKLRMLNIPLFNNANPYSSMRDFNHQFDSEFLSQIPKTNLLWHDPTYLRCLYYTIHHISNVHSNGTRHLYVNALIDIMMLNQSPTNTMNRSFRRQLNSIWNKYFCDGDWSIKHYNSAPFGGYYGYARDYVYLLVYAFCIEIGLFWLFIECTSNDFKELSILRTIWISRDALHLMLFIVIIWMYFESIKSEIKYRYCWKHDEMLSFGVGAKYSQLMHDILWLNIVGNNIDVYIMESIDTIKDVEWMTKLVLEYCTAYNVTMDSKEDDRERQSLLTNYNLERVCNVIYGNESNDETQMDASDVISLIESLA
eukprot:227529_1